MAGFAFDQPLVDSFDVRVESGSLMIGRLAQTTSEATFQMNRGFVVVKRRYVHVGLVANLGMKETEFLPYSLVFFASPPSPKKG